MNREFLWIFLSGQFIVAVYSGVTGPVPPLGQEFVNFSLKNACVDAKVCFLAKIFSFSMFAFHLNPKTLTIKNQKVFRRLVFSIFSRA